ncbi:MAG: hypothetical protein MJ233_00920 [Mycoplasmoidaceae bacterium]|nr:hypothetical protein [Mycoplasmoidaceae bacterium]
MSTISVDPPSHVRVAFVKLKVIGPHPSADEESQTYVFHGFSNVALTTNMYLDWSSKVTQPSQEITPLSIEIHEGVSSSWPNQAIDHVASLVTSSPSSLAVKFPPVPSCPSIPVRY